MSPDDARAFIREHHRAVLVTRRTDGGVQTSPVIVDVDDVDEDGKLVISSRETAYKVRNLRHQPQASVCVISEEFFGPWVQVDGTAEIVSLPEAMDGLVAYYRRLSGEHPDWEEYREAMRSEQRVLVRISVDRAGPQRSG